MIGQKNLQARLYTMIQTGIYPRFSIIEGEVGSGRRTLAYEIAKQLEAPAVTIPDLGINSVREMIERSYTMAEKCCYIIPDADDMSIAAKNSLLKITEETPNNAYIIMTVKDKNSMLDTIISRATIFTMERYSFAELLDFVQGEGIKLDDKAFMIGDTPGQLLTLNEIGFDEFYTYVEKVVDNIAEVSGANAFKIASKVSMKEGDDGYPMDLFLKAFMYLVSVKHDDPQVRFSAVRATSNALKDLRLKGINKKMLMDSWILDVREGWLQ